jgi:hypothetical protein
LQATSRVIRGVVTIAGEKHRLMTAASIATAIVTLAIALPPVAGANPPNYFETTAGTELKVSDQDRYKCPVEKVKIEKYEFERYRCDLVPFESNAVWGDGQTSQATLEWNCEFSYLRELEGCEAKITASHIYSESRPTPYSGTLAWRLGRPFWLGKNFEVLVKPNLQQKQEEEARRKEEEARNEEARLRREQEEIGIAEEQRTKGSGDTSTGGSAGQASANASSGAGASSVAGFGPVTIDSSAINATLGKLLLACSKQSRARYHLLHGGLVFSVAVPAGGSLSLSWLAGPLANSHGVSAKTVLLAEGKLQTQSASVEKLRLELTRAGRRVLGRGSRHIRIAATASFVPSGATQPVKKTLSFTL